MHTQFNQILIDVDHIGVVVCVQFAIGNATENVELVMPDERIADCRYFSDVFLVDRGQIQISVGINKCYLSLRCLLRLVQIYLQYLQSMVDCEVEWLTTSNLKKLYEFAVCSVDDSNNVVRHGDSLAVQKLDCVKRRNIHLAPDIFGFDTSFPS